MQSVATATEELSASVEEIGRQVRESSRIAEAAVVQAKETDAPDRQAVACRAADRRSRQADHGDRRADQSSGAQRHHRGGARRRSRPRLCGGRQRSEVAGQPDREGDRRDFLAHRRHAGRDAGVGRRDQGDRRHHRQDLVDIAPSIAERVKSRARRRRRSPAASRTSRRAPRTPPPTSARSTAAPPKPARRRRRCSTRRKTLSSESTRLRAELDRFMANIRAA